MSKDPDFLHTKLCDLLSCKYPIIQTAMGWVSTPHLVVSTINAGGFGFLAAAVMQVSQIEQSIKQIKKQSNHNFGVNFHYSFVHYASQYFNKQTIVKFLIG